MARHLYLGPSLLHDFEGRHQPPHAPAKTLHASRELRKPHHFHAESPPSTVRSTDPFLWTYHALSVWWQIVTATPFEHRPECVVLRTQHYTLALTLPVMSAYAKAQPSSAVCTPHSIQVVRGRGVERRNLRNCFHSYSFHQSTRSKGSLASLHEGVCPHHVSLAVHCCRLVVSALLTHGLSEAAVLTAPDLERPLR